MTHETGIHYTVTYGSSKRRFAYVLSYDRYVHHPSEPFRIRQQPSHAFLKNSLALVVVVVVAITLGLLLNRFVVQSFYVDGESMAPTLRDDDRLIISKVERTLAAVSGSTYIPERGQIVIINGAASPETQSRAHELIKRVVAVPGDTINITEGVVTITTESGERLLSDTALGLDLASTYTQTDTETVVPDGHVFVLGDNRARGGSHDSRNFGLVKTEHIDGRLWLRIMPFSSWRVF